MARKLVADMTPEEREEYREYMRQAKARSREGSGPEEDRRGYRDRAGYMREYRLKKKAEGKGKGSKD